MTTIIIQKTESGDFAGFTCEGHADYKYKGDDIVCAAISVLTINTINSLEVLVKEPMEVSKNEESGLISVRFTQKLSEQGRLLIESYILGLSEVFNNYGKKHIHLEFDEV
jgi:uncharacterized protein YsxB (DUF464 family)